MAFKPVLVFAAVLLLAVLAAPAEGASVKVSGRSMYVNGKQFFAKGVDYGVVPYGQTIGSKDGRSWDWQSSPAVYNRDLPNMKAMGVNTIRTYSWRNNVAHNGFLDACHAHGIYVTIGFGWNWNDFNGGSAGRQRMRDSLVQLVRNHARHPAVLMWTIGNELNAGGRNYQSNVWQFIGELRDLVHKTEASMGVGWHPVGSPLADGGSIYTIMQNANSKVDVWMLQLYRGKTFYDFFTRYAQLSTKPMFITEYGVDSWVNGASTSSAEQQQSEWNSPMWTEILKNYKVCSGGYVFNWSDGWWKCPGGSRSVHEKCPKAGGTRFPGGEVNEEWFGLNAIVNTKVAVDGADVLRKKPAYYKFQALFKTTPPNRLDDELYPELPAAEAWNPEEGEEFGNHMPIDEEALVNHQPHTESNRSRVIAIAAGVAGGVTGLVVIGAIVGFVIFRRSKAASSADDKKEQELAATPSQANLLTATPSESELVATVTDSQSEISADNSV